jgi:DNA-binding MarR family transcriptional regulator
MRQPKSPPRENAAAEPPARALRAASPGPRTPPARRGGSAKPPAADLVLAPALSKVIGYLLRRSHNVFHAYWMAHFRESETPITPVQGGMLVLLAANPGLTQAGLARMMNIEGPTLMQLVDRLEGHGYLRRVRRSEDRRSYALQVTPLGESLLAAIDAFVAIQQRDLLVGLSQDETALLAKLLTLIVKRGRARVKALQTGSSPATVRESSRRRPKSGLAE